MNNGDGCLKQILIGAIGQLIGALLFVVVGIGIYLIFYFDVFNPLDNFSTNSANSSTQIISSNMPINQPATIIAPSAEPTLSEYQAALQRAIEFNGIQNVAWIPYVYEFPDGIPMALVPRGCFHMGAYPDGYTWNGRIWIQGISDGGLQCFEPFWIDITEVTQGQFESLEGIKSINNTFFGGDRPVERITWMEAVAYCGRIGKRLLTEAEWEYAARGVENVHFPWGNEWHSGMLYWGWNSDGTTVPVATYPNGVSWIGAFDMAGNVWEWTSSEYRNYPYIIDDGRENLDNTTSERVLRGGSLTNDSYVFLSATRFFHEPSFFSLNIGFRCALDID